MTKSERGLIHIKFLLYFKVEEKERLHVSLTPSQARALSKAPYVHEMEDPDVTTSQELHLMQRMGLPTCFLNSPRDLDSDDEVCTAETHLIFHFYSFIALRHLNL